MSADTLEEERSQTQNDRNVFLSRTSGMKEIRYDLGRDGDWIQGLDLKTHLNVKAKVRLRRTDL